MTIKNEFKACDKCDEGYIYNDKSEVTKCKCLEEYLRNKKLEHMLSKANIPLQISSDPKAVNLLDYKLDVDYVGEDKNGNLSKIAKFIEKFDSKYSSLNMYWYGECGSQKTVLSTVIGRELLKQNKTVYYALADDLVKMTLDASRDEDLKKEVERILNVDFLILDEYSTDKITLFSSSYQLPYMTTFLKKRLGVLRKSTLFLSNTRIDNLGEKFGVALNDLVQREVLDPQTFEDNYKSKAVAFDVKDLWND